MLNNLYQTIRVLVAIYARLSKDDERYGDSVSIENQISILTKYAEDRGWEVVEIYSDM